MEETRYSIVSKKQHMLKAERVITLWFLSSVSSVDVSVIGLASAMLDSPQFSRWPLDTEIKFDWGSFCSGIDWDPTICDERFISEEASV